MLRRREIPTLSAGRRTQAGLTRLRANEQGGPLPTQVAADRDGDR